MSENAVKGNLTRFRIRKHRKLVKIHNTCNIKTSLTTPQLTFLVVKFKSLVLNLSCYSYETGLNYSCFFAATSTLRGRTPPLSPPTSQAVHPPQVCPHGKNIYLSINGQSTVRLAKSISSYNNEVTII